MPEVERHDVDPLRTECHQSGSHNRAASPGWVRSANALWRVTLDDVVLAAADRDDPPFAVSGGAPLWRLLASGGTAEDLAASLGAEGQEVDLERLLVSLAEAGLVERVVR